MKSGSCQIQNLGPKDNSKNPCTIYIYEGKMLNTIWSQMGNLLSNCFKQLQDNVNSCESLMITTEKYQISMILA